MAVTTGICVTKPRSQKGCLAELLLPNQEKGLDDPMGGGGEPKKKNLGFLARSWSGSWGRANIDVVDSSLERSRSKLRSTIHSLVAMITI